MTECCKRFSISVVKLRFLLSNGRKGCFVPEVVVLVEGPLFFLCLELERCMNEWIQCPQVMAAVLYICYLNTAQDCYILLIDYCWMGVYVC